MDNEVEKEWSERGRRRHESDVVDWKTTTIKLESKRESGVLETYTVKG